MYTCVFRINANLVKEGSFRVNAKLVMEESMSLVTCNYISLCNLYSTEEKRGVTASTPLTFVAPG